MKFSLKSLLTKSTRPLILVGIPCIATLASCSTTSTPIAHRHGELIHSHALNSANVSDHKHESKTNKAKPAPKSAKTTIVKTANKKVSVPVQSAKPADIKPLGIKGIAHKHHTHVEPKTSVESVPC